MESEEDSVDSVTVTSSRGASGSDTEPTIISDHGPQQRSGPTLAAPVQLSRHYGQRRPGEAAAEVAGGQSPQRDDRRLLPGHEQLELASSYLQLH